MIRFKKLSLFQGAKLLLEQIDVTLYADQKLGIVGKNGCGKSSLFQLLQAELAAEKGVLEMPQKWQIASARQETPASELTALDYVLTGHHEYHRLNQQLAVAEKQQDGNKIAEIHAQFDAINAWTLPAQAAKLLAGLSFSQTQIETPVKSLSGGWRMRLNLAQALLQPADLLLLDEPTNHLDLEAVIWLQDYLSRYQGMLMVISHDRDFLDGFASHIMHFDQQKIDLYTGNYSSFEKQRSQKLILQQAEFNKQQQAIEHLQKFIQRFKAKASKATQAQSRVKALEKMDKISAVEIRTKFSFEFASINKNITQLIHLDDVAVGYQSTTVLSQIKMQIFAGQRIGLLGRNGEGKSTLIKLICGELEKQSGEINKNQHFKAGYFAQHQVDQLNLHQSALWHIQSLDNKISEQQARNFLGGFAFHGDKVLDKVDGFSGGEKARLVLAMIVWQKPNLLLLDEPTNHFDIEMREALALALQDYQGAVILVAHDKNLMQSVVDEFWLVNCGEVNPFDGDLADYQQWLNENAWSASQKSTNHSNNTLRQKKQQKRLAAEKRQQKSLLTNRLKKLEETINKAQIKSNQLQEQLTDSQIYSEENKHKLTELIKNSQNVKDELKQLEHEWLEVSEQLDS